METRWLAEMSTLRDTCSDRKVFGGTRAKLNPPVIFRRAGRLDAVHREEETSDGESDSSA